MEWMFCDRHHSIRLCRDDFVLWKLVTECKAGRAWSAEEIVSFYIDRFAKHRFLNGIIPYPAGLQPDIILPWCLKDLYAMVLERLRECHLLQVSYKASC